MFGGGCDDAFANMIGKRGTNMRENELAVSCAHLSAEIALSTAIVNRTCYYATAVSIILSP